MAPEESGAMGGEHQEVVQHALLAHPQSGQSQTRFGVPTGSDTVSDRCHVCSKRAPNTASDHGDVEACECPRCICFGLICDEQGESLECGHVTSLG